MKKLSAVIIALMMVLTITSQVPAFALEEDAQEQLVTEQPEGLTEGQDAAQNDEEPGELTEEGELADEADAVQLSEPPAKQSEETEAESAEPEPEPSVELMAAGTLITASGLTKLTTKPTSAKWDGKTIDISWYNPTQTEFTISTGAELAGLAALVNGSYDKTIKQYYGTATQLKYIQCVKIDDFAFTGAGGGRTGGTCYKATGKHDFMGKTVTVTKALDMTAANYMPIGGKYPMCDAGGSMYVKNEGGKGDAHVIEAYFNGILDCGGHTIKIKCNRATNSGYAYSMAVGFIGYMGMIIDKDEAETSGLDEQQTLKNWTPAVKNLSLEGTVHARRQIGGVVGQTGDSWDGEYGVFVENCANHARVSGTDSKGVGGVVGNAGGKGHIINCYNTGEISSTYYNAPVGGVCASNSGMDLYNCYNAGKMSGNNYGRGLGGHNSGSYTIDNCFTLEKCNTDTKEAIWYKGTAADITLKNIDVLKKDDMTNEGFMQLLNAGDGEDNYDQGVFRWDAGKNGGYPILYFENGESGENCAVTITGTDNGSVQGLYNGVLFSSGDSVNVPFGSVVTLLESHDPGYILSSFKAGSGSADMTLLADFCSVTEDLNIGAAFVKLKEGTLLIDDAGSKDCTVAVTKKGLFYKDGEITSVKRQKTITGDKIYQLDAVTVSATLYDSVYPSDINKEYSGEFKYSFKYMKDGSQIGDTIENYTGRLAVDRKIDGAQLVAAAEPVTQPKTWQSFADTSWYDNGEPGEDYVIDSAEDLAGLAYLVNVEQITFSGETITIPSGTVISLKNTDGRGGTLLWPGIGVNTSSAYFAGTLEGNGCTVLDMSMIDEAGSNGGLFNYCIDASISGIRVRGETKVHSGGGGIIGYGQSCKISKCINYVDVTNQKSKADGEDEEGPAGYRAGGIIAQADGGTIADCINRGDISGNTGVGGIAGHCHNAEVAISRCTNYGAVTTSEYSDTYDRIRTGQDGVGGIVGRAYGNISLCANYGDVLSTDAATGGIAGYIIAKGVNKAFTVSSSYNRGKVDIRGSEYAMGSMYAGGLIGRCGTVVLTNCYSTGTVSGSTGGSYICGGVGYFDCKSGTSAKNNYVITCSKAWGKPDDVEPDYISIAVKTGAYMKTEAFASALNNAEYKAVSNSYPEFKRMTAAGSIEKMCTVTFRGSDLDGRSFTINTGGSIPYINAGDWSTYRFTLDGEEWTGRNITEDVTVDVVKNEGAAFNAVFKADGQVVAESAYDQSTDYESIKPDAALIVGKDGYAGKWPDAVTLNSQGDTIVNAVYYPSGSTIDIQGDVSLPDVAVTDGKYYIGGKSTGVITVAEGSNVTLIGDSGMCENLRVIMEEGSTLTAKNLRISCDTEPVLTMKEGSTLTLSGNKGFIEGLDTDSKDCVPAINVLGNSTINAINGTGTLKATSETGDTVIDIADGKELKFESGELRLHKDSKIGGFEGGVINSGREDSIGTGSLTITGGTVYCTSNSDNMHAVKIGTFNMSGGDVLLASNDAAKAILAKTMNVSKGNLKVFSADYAKNETDKSVKNRTYYYNEKAIGCTSFTNSYVCNKVLVNNMAKPYEAVVGDTTFNCEGLSKDYNIDGEKLVKTTDANVYIWSPKGTAASVAPGGADMSDPDNQRGYAVTRNDNSVNVDMTGTKGYKKTWYKACATYDASGNMLQFKYKQIKDDTPLEMSTLSGSAVSYEVFVLQNVKTLVPGLASMKSAK